jgi:hypothetical protein
LSLLSPSLFGLRAVAFPAQPRASTVGTPKRRLTPVGLMRLGGTAAIAEEPTVAISPELEAQILSDCHVEKWRVGTIARQLGIHHGTVDRVLPQAGLPKAGLPKAAHPHRPSLIDAFLPFVAATLQQFPGLTASRLHAMVRERQGQAIRFHPTLLELAAQYRFEPRPVAVARGNEKGRVERAIRSDG